MVNGQVQRTFSGFNQHVGEQRKDLHRRRDASNCSCWAAALERVLMPVFRSNRLPFTCTACSISS